MGVETTAQRPKGRISRRQLFKYGAWTGAAATVGPILPAMTTAAHAHGPPQVLPAPKPIPGGSSSPTARLSTSSPRTTGHHPAVHRDPAHGPGRRAQRHHRLQGRHRPGLHVGTATGNDGRQYNLETDMRAMEGTYIAEDGSRQRGLFALI
jgi:hypothetical protein